MAEDDDISRRYRELPPEEPPRHVDDAIRAAARRAVRRQWYIPFAAAAIVVLGVAVTMQVDREQTGEEMAAAPAEEPKAEPSSSAPQPERRRETDSADSRELRDSAPPPELQKAPEPATAPAPPSPRAGAELRRSDEGARAAASVSAYALQSPDQWLQGIADLRRQGRHEEADKSLAEFRKRHPDYRISEELLEQVDKR